MMKEIVKMKTTVTRLKLLCVSLMVMSLMLVGISFAEIDFADCVGMWLFDEGNGNKAEDSSGTGNDGSIEGGAKWVNGKFGKGLSLDGSDAYVEIAHDDSLNVGAEHTIALWFKLDKPPAGGMAVVTKDDWAPGFWWDANIIRHHTHDPGATLHYIDAPWKPDTDWHHVAAIWDGEEFIIYLDADEIGAGVTGPNLGRNALTDKPVLIGIYLATGQHGQWGAFLGAIIDDVAIFNVALSDDDIETLMNDGLKTAADIEPSGKLTTTWADIKAD
jgi:hypothetical protein